MLRILEEARLRRVASPAGDSSRVSRDLDELRRSYRVIAGHRESQFLVEIWLHNRPVELCLSIPQEYPFRSPIVQVQGQCFAGNSSPWSPALTLSALVQRIEFHLRNQGRRKRAASREHEDEICKRMMTVRLR